MENQQQPTEAAPNGTNQNFFVGSVPHNYDTYMGPMLLNPFALDITQRVKLTGKVKVLELAAGTGRVTRPLLALLPEAHIVATDISDDMMAIAKETIQAPNLEWQNVSMDNIPYPDDSFDLIICQFGVMFVNDKLQALKEMHRVLKPNGQLLFNTWGSISENPIWRISFQSFAETFGQSPLPPEVGPFALQNGQPVIEMLVAAHFNNITATPVHKTTEIESASLAATGFLSIQPILKQKPEAFPALHQKLTLELSQQLGDNPLMSPLLALVFEATK